MRTGKIAYKITGIFMILGGLCAIVTAVMVFISRLSAAGALMTLSAAAAALNLIWAVLNIYLGFSAFGRINNKQLKKGFFLGIVSVILFIFQSLLAAANGIVIIHLLILIVCGFVIPCLYIYICRFKM